MYKIYAVLRSFLRFPDFSSASSFFSRYLLYYHSGYQERGIRALNFCPVPERFNARGRAEGRSSSYLGWRVLYSHRGCASHHHFSSSFPYNAYSFYLSSPRFVFSLFFLPWHSIVRIHNGARTVFTLFSASWRRPGQNGPHPGKSYILLVHPT